MVSIPHSITISVKNVYTMIQNLQIQFELRLDIDIIKLIFLFNIHVTFLGTLVEYNVDYSTVIGGTKEHRHPQRGRGAVCYFTKKSLE